VPPTTTTMDHRLDATVYRCAECGIDGGIGLKSCKACMDVKYCNAECQHKHWPTHKKQCKQRAAELSDEALFKDPPAKEDCPICFLPMPIKLLSCISLSNATVTSVPIYDFSIANKELKDKAMDEYYPCCGKSICRGCAYSFAESENDERCPFCNSDRGKKTAEENIEDITKRVEVNDAGAIYMLADSYYQGLNGIQQDQTKAMELYARAAELGHSKAHSNLGNIYYMGGDLKKAKFHLEAAAMAGHEVARNSLGLIEYNSGNKERAMKYWTIAASAGDLKAMPELRLSFEQGYVNRESINSTLVAYNNSCAEMRSEARDAVINMMCNDQIGGS